MRIRGLRDGAQKTIGLPVRFELSEQTRQAVGDYLKATSKRPGAFLFTGHRGPARSMTTRQSARRLLPSPWQILHRQLPD
jgi:integrase